MLRHSDEWPPEFESAGSLAAVTVSRAASSLALPGCCDSDRHSEQDRVRGAFLPGSDAAARNLKVRSPLSETFFWPVAANRRWARPGTEPSGWHWRAASLSSPAGRPARPGARRAWQPAADSDRHGRWAIPAQHLLASDNSTGGNKVTVTP